MPYPIAVTTDLSATLPNLRPCCVLQVGGFRPSGDERACFEGAARLAPNEPWPSDARGAPMALIAQLNLSSAPWRPEELRQHAALQVFLGAQWRDEAARDWRVITRASWHDLTLQADPPEPGTMQVGRPVRRTEARWMPLVDESQNAADGRTKLWGWPCEVQQPLEFDTAVLRDGVWQTPPDEPRYLLQIDHAADSTLVYLGLAQISGAWHLTHQRY